MDESAKLSLMNESSFTHEVATAPIASAMDVEQILMSMPLKYSAILVDRVLETTPFVSISGYKNITTNEPFMIPYGSTRIMPPILMLEALFQMGAILIYSSEKLDLLSTSFVPLGLERTKFRHQASAGDRLTLQAELTEKRSNIWKFHGQTIASGRKCVEADWFCSIVAR